MTDANWIALATPVLVAIGGLWYVIRLEIKTQHIKDLERELDKKDTEIQFLKETIERKNDAIMSLK